MINTNPDNGIAYGYISANSLDPEVVCTLQMHGEDVHYQQAKDEFVRDRYEAHMEAGGEAEFDQDAAEDEFAELHADRWDDPEPVHQGTYEGVKYRTSWLGGALNVWIFESPHITHLARRASPCVPGAAILDTLDGNVTGYDVPPDWRA